MSAATTSSISTSTGRRAGASSSPAGRRRPPPASPKWRGRTSPMMQSEWERARLVVLFDGWCGFCTRCVEWVRARDSAGRVLALPNQTPGIRERFGLSKAQVDRELYAIARDRRVYHGAAAVARVFRELGGPWPLA